MTGGVRTFFRRIVQEMSGSQQGPQLVRDPETHGSASDVYLDEDYVRRVCGRLRGQRQSVLAVVQVTEEIHVERGMDVPAWLQDVRREHGLL